MNFTQLHKHKDIPEYHQIKPNFDCNYIFPIDFDPSETGFGDKAS